jgi:hypothetical protein
LDLPTFTYIKGHRPHPIVALTCPAHLAAPSYLAKAKRRRKAWRRRAQIVRTKRERRTHSKLARFGGNANGKTSHVFSAEGNFAPKFDFSDGLFSRRVAESAEKALETIPVQ